MADTFEADAIARMWLAEMQACVRAVDFARAHAIFVPEVVGFGSRAAMLDGLEALERDQWRHVWGAIRNFTFLVDQLQCGGGGDVVWLACPWTSEGRETHGEWHERPGRMTAVLRCAGDRWLAVHTHHSLVPQS